MAKKKPSDPVLVVGLGRFGSSVAEHLENLGHEVLAVESDLERVQHWSGRLTSTVQTDCTDDEAMRQIGADDFRWAIVAIGSNIESSVLAVSVLSDLGIPCIWAKALTIAHGRILERVGAARVIYPEYEMGERIAHTLTGRMLDYIEFDDDVALVKTLPHRDMVDKPLGESAVRGRHGVTVVCVKRPGESEFTYATADTVVHEGDVIVVAGKTKATEDFANLY